IFDLLAKLEETIELKPEESSQNQKLQDLIAGKFNNDKVYEFLNIVKEIIVEINSVEPVKQPCVKYLDTNKTIITESALHEL
ncbi:MAG: hypothetical protein HQK78_20075, partial [Desulfobacterales bacterium]|nr:hypothetical protein [Desulfobacterales bacterium]